VKVDGDKAFTGSIPQIYDSFLVPLIFEAYAADLAGRVGARAPRRVLEVAAGTGVATRALARALPGSAAITAIDLNQAMLDRGVAVGTPRAVEWRQADVSALPFDDQSFDAVVCQFAAMFFPDRSRAFAEIRRVLQPGGAFIFSVWDRIEENEFADVATAALAALFPDDPPRFLARSPHGYFDVGVIERDLRMGGFGASPDVVTLSERSRATSARIPAVGYCQGTPLRNEIEARNPAMLDRATDEVERAIARRFGGGAVDGKIQAHVISLER
jgi:SAM-dependent methyltransferase